MGLGMGFMGAPGTRVSSGKSKEFSGRGMQISRLGEEPSPQHFCEEEKGFAHVSS